MSRPTVVLFDVNETLSDLEPLRTRFEEVGAPGHLLETWFASTLRDGIALAAAGRTPTSGRSRSACSRNCWPESRGYEVISAMRSSTSSRASASSTFIPTCLTGSAGSRTRE